MASGDHAEPSIFSDNASLELGEQWRRFTRSATLIAVLTSPAIFVWLYYQSDLHLGWALAWTFIAVILFRGVVDVIVRRFIPWPSLFGTVDKRLKEEDVVNRRRAWFWRKWIRRIVFVLALFTVIWLVRLLDPRRRMADLDGEHHGNLGSAQVLSEPAAAPDVRDHLPGLLPLQLPDPAGPADADGNHADAGFEPGDADWGVQARRRARAGRGQGGGPPRRHAVAVGRGVRGGGRQARARPALPRRAGHGQDDARESDRHGLQLPVRHACPGSGFAQTFMGMDAVIVRYLAWKAKRLAAKWGGQCIVFIDEIDAVGMRRRRSAAAERPRISATSASRFDDHASTDRSAPSTRASDLILETRAWRERLFEARAPRAGPPTAGFRSAGSSTSSMPGMMGGGMGQLALNQLLVVMDGIDNPPFLQRVCDEPDEHVPRRVLRRPAQDRQGASCASGRRSRGNEQIYFIGATTCRSRCSTPHSSRPGRMGRHVWFRTPTKQDRLDIFDLYIDKVDHEPGPRHRRSGATSSRASRTATRRR